MAFEYTTSKIEKEERGNKLSSICLEDYIVAEISTNGTPYRLVFGPKSYESCLGYNDIISQHNKGHYIVMSATRFFRSIRETIGKKYEKEKKVVLSPKTKEMYEKGEYILC